MKFPSKRTSYNVDEADIRKLPQRPAKSLHQEALQLLKQPEVTRKETRNDSDLDTSRSTSESESNVSNIEDDVQDFCYYK
ncbi:unnamed protein product [Acanthoscelides obtectus]|uniref:Uncharacterized protein n=1 Tax=Acanthoscelides obtectus TaxID=200917 RepID=A0A9P0PAQ2_ACAOB|nr:unnamed protein product [Acanthoscelides obtectus]CAK1627845.1 hypothetical protein AOBTE_LOCUS4857 [Acanthoscelides obtectus]